MTDETRAPTLDEQIAWTQKGVNWMSDAIGPIATADLETLRAILANLRRYEGIEKVVEAARQIAIEPSRGNQRVLIDALAALDAAADDAPSGTARDAEGDETERR